MKKIIKLISLFVMTLLLIPGILATSGIVEEQSNGDFICPDSSSSWFSFISNPTTSQVGDSITCNYKCASTTRYPSNQVSIDAVEINDEFYVNVGLDNVRTCCGTGVCYWQGYCLLSAADVETYFGSASNKDQIMSECGFDGQGNGILYDDATALVECHMGGQVIPAIDCDKCKNYCRNGYIAEKTTGSVYAELDCTDLNNYICCSDPNLIKFNPETAAYDCCVNNDDQFCHIEPPISSSSECSCDSVEISLNEQKEVNCEIIVDSVSVPVTFQVSFLDLQGKKTNTITRSHQTIHPEVSCPIKLENPLNSYSCRCNPQSNNVGGRGTCSVMQMRTGNVNVVDYRIPMGHEKGTSYTLEDYPICSVYATTCETDGKYDGNCPNSCKSWEDPDCDYGRTGELFTNYIFELIDLIPGVDLPTPMEWWNSRLQEEGTIGHTLYNAVEELSIITPTGIANKICEFGGDTFQEELADYPIDQDENWVPPPEFTGLDAGLSFGAQYDGYKYMVSWSIYEMPSNPGEFTITLRNEYNTYISYPELKIYPITENRIAVSDGTFDYEYITAQEYDTICFTFYDNPVFEQSEYCRSVIKLY